MGVTVDGRDEESNSTTVAVSKSRFRYNSPLVQVCFIGLVCFCCPGMFNALSGMGGGGQVDHTAANNANTALYTTFAVFGILGGGIYNILGPRITLLSACSTYVLYAGSFLYYNHYKHQSFAIAAGALLGIGAGLLWAAEGAIMTSYPPPNRKGTYISLFWSIFNMGGVIGGLIPFILNYHRSDAASVNDATYIGFMCFMSAGALLSLAILPPNKVVRDDGTRCSNIKYSKVSTEVTEILKLFLNWKMLLIVPASWASNFFYSYQFNNVNGLQFNLRTRGLNNVFIGVHRWWVQLGLVTCWISVSIAEEQEDCLGLLWLLCLAPVSGPVDLPTSSTILTVSCRKSWISRTLVLVSRVHSFCISVMDCWMLCFKAWFIGSLDL
ncbi:hypothetical protein Dsin_000736 [Dipteronia sinensis]|uniref:UNC93-like protein 1 n=1 Tax=Dipteronia sinensis TaxID=43782 RepID=A0AAE0B3W9_9ROSI|nr:hypothetical protein Dsin_000736 [Dipteronia sinensis]